MKRGSPSIPRGARVPARKQAALSPKAQQLFEQGQKKTESGDFEGAAAAFRAVVQLRPDIYQVQFNLGRALVELGRDEEALVPLQRVLALQPNHLKAITRLAHVHGRLGNLAEALALFQKAQQLDPLDAILTGQLAATLVTAGRDEEAMEVYEKALKLAPENAVIHYNLGNLVRKHKGDALAIPYYARAVELDPDYTPAWSNLGTAHRKSSPEKAAQYFRKALSLDTNNLATLYGLLAIEQRACDFDSTEEVHAKILEAIRKKSQQSANWQTASNLVYKSLFLPFPWEAVHALENHIAMKLEREARAQGSLPELAQWQQRDNQPLRIGYLSPNFGDHPVGQVTLSLFPAHDRQRFEIHAFSTRSGGSDGSEIAIMHRSGFDAFHEIGGKAAKEAATYIRSVGIDILVDLDGYMDNTSPPILAFRAAPVQAFWLGHAGGLGLPFVDYLIADAIVLPRGEESNYHESIVRLPDIYHCADRHPIAQTCPPRAAYNLPEEATVYCVFNNPDKIDRRVFDCWMRILKQVDRSVLWFSPFRQNADTLLANLRRYAEQHGIEPERLILSEREPDKSVHFARLRHADLMLDTLTLNASTTALDSLWAGVPLLAVRGEQFSNRISNSMLHAIGFDDMVCANLEEYERRAIELGQNPAARSELRRRLHENLDATPLFDIRRFTRNLERAYEAMWERHRNGQPPAGIDLPPD